MTREDPQELAGIEFVLDSPDLLRKKWRGLRQAQEVLREEANEQMRSLGRHMFDASRGLAVQLDFHHPHAPNQPQIPLVVKAYLDAFETVAYENDRQVQCLTVHRRALDHPMMAGVERSNTDAFVYASIRPVERYTELYDRAIRRAWLDRSTSPWRVTWTVRQDVELRNLQRELRSISGQDVHLAELVRLLEERRLRSGALADLDRPGPLPRAAAAVHRLFALPVLHQRLRSHHGALLQLPLRGGGPGTSLEWKDEVQRAIEAFPRTGAPFRGFVALDVSVRGDSLNGKDLDNLVHGFLGPFEAQLCAARGTVASYRVYQAVGDPPGVQVRLLDDGRMLALEIAMAEAAELTRMEVLLERLAEARSDG